MPVQYRSMRAPHESASRFAYRILEMYILEMRLLPGDKLSEAEIAAKLGISRTPVHNTFAQLARGKMLSVEPQRGTFVPLLDSRQIPQVARICKKLDLATLETIYSLRPTPKQLMPLYNRIESEQDALAGGMIDRMARLNMEYHRELYMISGFLPVHYAIRRINADLYRLLRMVGDADFWHDFADRHLGIADALQARDNDTACFLMGREYETVEPLLERMQGLHPGYYKSRRGSAPPTSGRNT